VYDPTEPIEYASDYWLTTNNGSQAVAISGAWTSVAAEIRGPDGDRNSVSAFEWQVQAHQGTPWPYHVWEDGGLYHLPGDASVAVNSYWKQWLCSENDIGGVYKNRALVATDALTGQDVDFHRSLTGTNHVCVDHDVAGLCYPAEYPAQLMVAAYTDNYADNDRAFWGLHDKTSDNHGQNWSDSVQILPDTYIEDDQPGSPSLAVNSTTAGEVYVAYQLGADDADPEIVFKKSDEYGASESWDSPVTLGHGLRPCLAAAGRFVVVCWHKANRIAYVFSRDAGIHWSDPDTIRTARTGICDHTSAAVLTYGSPADTAILVVSQYSTTERGFVFYGFGALVHGTTPHIAWQLNVRLSDIITADPDRDSLRPGLATAGSGGRWIFNAPIDGHKRGFYLRSGVVGWVPDDNGPWPRDAVSTSTGRRIARASDGSIQYASVIRPHVVSGPTDADIPPMLVAPGSQPGLALDGDGEQWIAYVCSDTVWVVTGDGSYEAVFGGSSSAVPGQPSIVCYPGQANGVYVGAVTFACYDTVQGASMVLWARVDTSGVVLDTVETVANLRDSLPSINVFRSDSLVIVYSRGDSVLSKLLADYGPSTQGQPPAWSSVNLVTANGYHGMSVMENGNVVNCCYTQQNGGCSIQRATCDLSSGGMFPSWVAMTPPSVTSNVEKANPVYCGSAGCSVWQQMSGSGKWTIKAFVRGEETTLVANDTDAYHPHAVAESSAASPSIDRIRLHLLYTAGVTFEVDSGVYDTGETRYSQFDFDVSNAGSDATQANNGAKLMRKEGSDSLFATYTDADGSVMYASSAAGDSWIREIVATDRSYPAIATDSTGKRWVVAQTGGGSMPMAQYLYYQSGGSWTPQTLYSVFAPLGPASLAGASSTTTGIAYAAFKVLDVSELIVLTKFDGTNVAACTLATGSGFGDPAVTVEPYTADSDHVHVTWEDAGVIKYRMDTDGRSSAIANNWTAVVTLSDAQATSHHPVISADRDRIVAAWAQGATADIYARQRSTDSTYNNWEAALNLSNTASDASDWPVIALGDTVVVAWQEARTGGSDFDILACIDFGDTLNIADNATVSSYPHVLFQNKASGDTCIPYLHTVFSEAPEAEYYEVAYNKLNLKQASGEGQQSASSTPVPAKASLAACRPNPFRDRTQINYALPTAGNVSLRVYDATGRTVRTLASGHQKAGSYSVTWDSKDNRGRQVARGVYFYRLATPGFRSVKKAVVTR